LSTIKVSPDTARSYTLAKPLSLFDISDKSLPTTGSDVIRDIVTEHREDSVIT